MGRRNVLVFGFDAAESSQIRRIRSLIDCGYDVTAFTMRRRNMNADFQPFWRNVHLFEMENERLGRRVLLLLLALFKIARHIGHVRRADVVMARNFDLLLLAHAARLMALRPSLPLIYECLDIHGAFTEQSRKGAAFRAVERFLLARIALLVVSSQGFVERYFRPVQQYAGPYHLMENKIWFGARRPERRADARNVRDGQPFVLGWVGSLRCEPSFSILLDAADRLGGKLLVAMHGNVHAHVLRDFEARLGARTNVAYHGPYAYPDGLAKVYRSCDFVWAQDLWQRGANSDWLLPNRIYEASYFGCLSIAVAGTETARTVAERNLGYVIDEPSADALVSLVEDLTPAAVEEKRGRLLAQPPRAFVYENEDVEAVIAKALDGSSQISHEREPAPADLNV